MAARKGARWLAPIALAATIAAIYVLVHRELGTSRSHSTASQTQGHVVVHHAHPSAPRPAAPATYVIRAGDNLSTIAQRTHVPLSTLEALNPGVNPSALQTGQRLRLRK